MPGMLANVFGFSRIGRSSQGGLTQIRRRRRLDFREIWHYRELLWILGLRDLQVRYKQTLLGLAWALIQPIFTALTLWLFLGKLAGMPSDGLPYAIFAYSGVWTWQLFANSLTRVSGSLVAEQALITKIYFPRLVVPLASLFAGVVDFAAGAAPLALLMIWYGMTPSWRLLTLPALFLLAIASALAVGLWLAALCVRYRDVRHFIPFMVQVWMFATPVAYPTSIIPEAWRWVYAINPMAGVVEGVRWALLGSGAMPLQPLLISFLVMAGLLAAGLTYFHRVQRTVADII